MTSRTFALCIGVFAALLHYAEVGSCDTNAHDIVTIENLNAAGKQHWGEYLNRRQGTAEEKASAGRERASALQYYRKSWALSPNGAAAYGIANCLADASLGRQAESLIYFRLAKYHLEREGKGEAAKQAQKKIRELEGNVQRVRFETKQDIDIHISISDYPIRELTITDLGEPIDPGTYLVTISAAGHASTQIVVQVGANESANPKVVELPELQRLPDAPLPPPRRANHHIRVGVGLGVHYGNSALGSDFAGFSPSDPKNLRVVDLNDPSRIDSFCAAAPGCIYAQSSDVDTSMFGGAIEFSVAWQWRSLELGGIVAAAYPNPRADYLVMTGPRVAMQFRQLRFGVALLLSPSPVKYRTEVQGATFSHQSHGFLRTDDPVDIETSIGRAGIRAEFDYMFSSGLTLGLRPSLWATGDTQISVIVPLSIQYEKTFPLGGTK